MGIKNCNKILWQAKGITLQSIKDLNIGTRIDVDGNLMVCNLSATGKPFNEVIGEMALTLKSIASSGGFQIQVIVDGDVRPDCKRATWMRKKQHELDKMNNKYCRLKVMEMRGRIESGRASESDKEKYSKYCTEALKLDSKCSKQISIPKDFVERLEEKLLSIGACTVSEGGGIVERKVLKAKFQADSLLAKRFIEGKSDFILSSDSDFGALIGDECILIKSIKKAVCGGGQRKKKRKDSAHDTSIQSPLSFEVTLGGPSNKKMIELKNKLHSRGYTSKAVWEKAENPILENESIEMRGLIALTLGCDILPKGLKNIGAPTLEKLIIDMKARALSVNNSTVTSTTVDFFKEHIAKKLNTGIDVVETLLAAFIFEPGVVDDSDSAESYLDKILNIDDEEEVIDEDKGSSGTTFPRNLPNSYYIHEEPEKLPRFLEAFGKYTTCKPINIVEGPDISQCSGSCCTSKHTYLSFEGSHCCTSCRKEFCQHCVFIPAVDVTKTLNKETKKSEAKVYYDDCKQVVCLNCMAFNRFGSEVDEEEHNRPSLNEMRRELNKNYSLQLGESLSLAETIEIYDAYISSPSVTRNNHHSQVKEKVKFPLLPSSAITQNHPKIKIIGEFPISEGGRFISNKKLVSDANLAKMMDLLASFVAYDESALVHSAKSDIGRFGFYPTNLLNFAFDSRVDSGHRLLSRCARHAMDPKTPCIIEQSAELFEYKDGGKLVNG